MIFSRKGFDSGAGGCPSPLVQGRPLSLPIPTRMPTPVRYADLAGEHGALVDDLTNGRITAATPCHLDPDLDPSLRPRLPGWRGALGQIGAAQGHLANRGVSVGDLFLFWGLFQPVERLRRWAFAGAREHRIFGWLQVGEIIDLGPDGSHAVERHPWLRDHPHARPGWSSSNVLYVASERLRLPNAEPDRPGWGVFADGLRLTGPDSPGPSLWNVPDWLNPARGGVGMTFHAPDRWGPDGTLRSAARGQEFVAEIAGRDDAAVWLDELFAGRA